MYFARESQNAKTFESCQFHDGIIEGFKEFSKANLK